MYIKRNLEEKFKSANDFFPALLITGPRQVGKTTFLTKIAEPERKFVSLDAPDLREFAKNDPRLFLSTYSPPVTIDEIQYAPELLPYVKIMIDETRMSTPEKAKGMFWFTGSQQFQMMKGVTESLAGRIGIFQLLGLSNSEFLGNPEIPFRPDLFTGNSLSAEYPNAFFERLWKGSFPELATGDANFWSDFYRGYLQTYLERDVRSLAQVADLHRFYAFIKTVAARTGQMLNYASIARDADISQPTAKSYLSILQTSGLVYLLYPYLQNKNKQMIKAPKLYMLDCGLAAYLTEWNTPNVLASGAMAGHFFETWCFSEILKSYYNSGKRPAFYYYRDKDQNEIDLIIEENGTLYPVEFKKAASLKKDDVKSFRILNKFNMQRGMGALVSLYPDLLQFKEDCKVIPAFQL
jgi:predicted AAA+ superfamily ATPase